MDFKEIAKKALADLAPQIEVAVKIGIEAKSDAVVDFLLQKLCDLIPSKIDDALLDSVKPQIKAEVKAFLLAKADEISPDPQAA